MDLPITVDATASVRNLYTVAANDAAGLQSKLDALVLALIADAVPHPEERTIVGVDLAAAGDGGLFEATITSRRTNDPQFSQEVVAEIAKFYVLDMNAGDGDIAASPVAVTTDPATSGQRMQELIRADNVGLNIDLYAQRSAGCNAGRRLMFLALVARSGG